MTHFELKSDAEEGIYPGIGNLKHGQKYPVQGDEHRALIKADPRMKFVQGDPEPAPQQADTTKGGKK